MRIMGIDPGYAIVGVGLVDYDNVRFSLVEYGAITTPAELSFETRLRQIYDDMVGLITQYRPDAVAMEQLFFTTNRTTAIAVAEAREYCCWPRSSRACRYSTIRRCRSNRRWWATARPKRSR